MLHDTKIFLVTQNNIFQHSIFNHSGTLRKQFQVSKQNKNILGEGRCTLEPTFRK